MRPRDIPVVLRAAAGIGKNVVLIGNPGIGKTVGVEEFSRKVAEEKGLPLYEAEDVDDLRSFIEEKCLGGNCVLYIYVNVNTALPVDLSGIPEKFRSDGDVYVRWVPLNLWPACRHAKYCIVFLDEFNTTENPDMQAAVMRMLGECRAGGVHLGCGRKRDGFTLVVAAGNPPTVSGIAMEPPAPLMGGKVIKVDVEPPTLQEWIHYMHEKYGNKWCPRVAAFLAMNPGYFSQAPSEPRTLTAYPTPRGWDAVARLCGTECKCKENKELIEGLVGPEATTALLANIDVAPTLDDVINERDVFARGLKFIAYSAVRYCSDTVTLEKLKKAMETLDEATIAAASYVAAPQCPQKMTLFHRAAGDKVPGLLRERFRLTEKTIDNTKDDILSELI